MDEQWILGYLFSVFSKIEKKIQTFEWKKISMHTLILLKETELAEIS